METYMDRDRGDSGVIDKPPRVQWKWELGFKEDLVHWLRELQWAAESRGQVTFVELALDFEAHAGRALPGYVHTFLRGSCCSHHHWSIAEW